MSSTQVVRLEFRGLHKSFGQLRSADQRSIVAAYRFGQVVDALHATGFTWQEMGEELDRSWHTIKLYAKLYNKYDTERDLLDTAEAMKTYNVARLAGNISMSPIQYVLHCLNCGSFEVKKERKHDDEEEQTLPVTPVQFKSVAN